jgi:hypothetical protein
MEKNITVEFKDHNKVILTDEVGNTYTSKSEEFIDFLHGFSIISFNLPIMPSLPDGLDDDSDCDHNFRLGWEACWQKLTDGNVL